MLLQRGRPAAALPGQGGGGDDERGRRRLKCKKKKKREKAFSLFFFGSLSFRLSPFPHPESPPSQRHPKESFILNLLLQVVAEAQVPLEEVVGRKADRGRRHDLEVVDRHAREGRAEPSRAPDAPEARERGAGH